MLLALGAVVLVWGMNWAVMKTALADMRPLDFAALRLGLASIFLFGCVVVLRRPLRVGRPGTMVLTGLFQTAISTSLILWALSVGGAGKNAVLCYTMPFWVALFAWPLLGERPSRRQWAALALAASGIVLLIWGSIGGTLADLAAIGSGVSWGIGIVLTKRLQGAQATDAIAFSAWQSLIGAVLVGAVALAFPGAPAHWTPALLLALAYNALLVYGVMWFLWFWVLQRLDAGIASLGTLGVPVVGVLAGVVLLGERPTPPEWAGMALVLAALVLTASVAARRSSIGAPRAQK